MLSRQLQDGLAKHQRQEKSAPDSIPCKPTSSRERFQLHLVPRWICCSSQPTDFRASAGSACWDSPTPQPQQVSQLPGRHRGVSLHGASHPQAPVTAQPPSARKKQQKSCQPDTGAVCEGGLRPPARQSDPRLAGVRGRRKPMCLHACGQPK